VLTMMPIFRARRTENQNPPSFTVSHRRRGDSMRGSLLFREAAFRGDLWNAILINQPKATVWRRVRIEKYLPTQ